MHYDLKNKVAIVTGASRGIGKAISVKLSNAGAKIALVSRSLDSLRSVQKKIIDNGKEAICIAADVSQSNDFMKVVKTVTDTWGQIDILINNAGITRDNIIMRLKEDDWDAVIDINLKGCFNIRPAI